MVERSRIPFRRILLLCVALVAGAGASSRRAASGGAPLVLERTIPLPALSGRIDHLAVDASHGWLFAAALGAGAVERVELASGRPLGRINGLSEPQGLAVLPGENELVVASGGDGTLRFYRESDLSPLARLALGADADNVRIDPASGHVLVGFGDGALAVVDARRRAILGRISTPAHPEGFQVSGGRAYVNLPGADAVGVADLSAGRLVETWPNKGLGSNFPAALDPSGRELAVAYRRPPRLVLFALPDGAVRQTLSVCGDADDLDFDRKRARLYVVCGDGHVDVFQRAGAGLDSAARIPTARGARTGLFDPTTDRLYVAAPAAGGRPAAILVLRPQEQGVGGQAAVSRSLTRAR